MGLFEEKVRVAHAAAALVHDGMMVGLGTGSTVAQLLVVLGARSPRARFVATSPATARDAAARGLDVVPFEQYARLDLAIDGADQVADDFWLIKGGGGAHAREKIVAAAAERFVVIVDSSKPVATPHSPVPLELSAFGLAATLEHLGEVRLRDAPRTPDGGVLADYAGAVDDPAALARRLGATPGVLAHGLFAPEMVSEVLIGRGEDVQRRERRGTA